MRRLHRLQRRSAIAEEYRRAVIEIPEVYRNAVAAVQRVTDRQMPRFSIDDLIGVGPVMLLTRSMAYNTQFTWRPEFKAFGAGEMELDRGNFGYASNHQVA